MSVTYIDAIHDAQKDVPVFRKQVFLGVTLFRLI